MMTEIAVLLGGSFILAAMAAIWWLDAEYDRGF